ncbi:GAF domain-containing protein [Sphingobacteriaceae bacterium WQ 2009]|uniref:histidine kinase n=1 Tax=Rhinopithecimicrobium faecis TaxID=2820698 RepID=A0A8T4HB02_9SPHI|nr:GAF domain-containing protein [Sphingobacteriaceae bacterium WQ 2009]
MLENILVQCHEEPIHIPAQIQSFGYLIGFHKTDLTPLVYSQNITAIIPDFQVGKYSLEAVIKTLHIAPIPPIQELLSPASPIFKHKQQLTIDQLTYQLSVYSYQDIIYLELEKNNQENTDFDFGAACQKLIGAKEDDLWEILVQQLADCIHYDRIMVYKFLHDKSGVVIAEHKKESLPSYLNLHYPEFDIPKQARQLYLKNTARILSDVADEPIPLLVMPSTLEKDAHSFDLTYSQLRALSPIHIQYLKNAGVQSSFSISIIKEHKLWGLLTCQNIQAQHLMPHQREQAELLCQIANNAHLTLQLKAKLQHQEQWYDLKRILQQKVLLGGTTQEAILSIQPAIMQVIKADGAAFLKNNQLHTTGVVPKDAVIRSIYQWALNQQQDNLYYSHTFFKDYKHLLPLDGSSAGIMICFIDDDRNDAIIWFKKELQQEISWAGKPEKITQVKMSNGRRILSSSPRISFQIWKQLVKDTARAWHEKDIEAALSIRQFILEIAYLTSSRIADLNQQLIEVNTELEAFSYTVSHDFNTPLAVIQLNTQMIARNPYDAALTEKQSKRIINEVEGMSRLMKNILALSKAKRVDLALTSVDVALILDPLLANLQQVYPSQEINILLEDIYPVYADETMVYQLFLNIVSNAFKYTSNRQKPYIIIKGEETAEAIIYRIKDNGIGIPEEELTKLFQNFTRMSNSQGFDGNGIGLCIVKRLIDRIGGEITIENNIGNGITCTLKFPHQQLT